MLYGVSGIMGISSVTYSRGLWVETLGLFAIALMLIYIFLTDANHIMPQIKTPDAYPDGNPAAGNAAAGAAADAQNPEPATEQEALSGKEEA